MSKLGGDGKPIYNEKGKVMIQIISIKDDHQRQDSTRRNNAKASTISEMAYKYSIGQTFVSPKNKLTFSTLHGAKSLPYDFSSLFNTIIIFFPIFLEKTIGCFI